MIAATATHTQKARHRWGALRVIVPVGAAVREAVSDIASTLVVRAGPGVARDAVSLNG
ncbi:hypothetical protein GCM10009807_28510 [Microbacterium lacus]|uniref:Uncharacterized protein n=1 Tax=Microbacterium lacus TaxID=415217 RepID=A0ABN2H6T3_9MICO